MIVKSFRGSLLCSCVVIASLSPALAEASANDYETVVVSASRYEEQARLQQKNALNIVNVQPAEAILKFLTAHHVSSIGRFGGWKYSYMEEAILEGKAAAERILGQ